jgi:hypothetical protein
LRALESVYAGRICQRETSQRNRPIRLSNREHAALGLLPEVCHRDLEMVTESARQQKP